MHGPSGRSLFQLELDHAASLQFGEVALGGRPAAPEFVGDIGATSLYMPTDYVNSHKDVVQKRVNAYVATLGWIKSHAAAEIADKMPADYHSQVGKDAYAKALDSEKGIFNPTRLMPSDGPQTCLGCCRRSTRTSRARRSICPRPSPMSS
jgi:hypothetical protein